MGVGGWGGVMVSVRLRVFGFLSRSPSIYFLLSLLQLHPLSSVPRDSLPGVSSHGDTSTHVSRNEQSDI